MSKTVSVTVPCWRPRSQEEVDAALSTVPALKAKRTELESELDQLCVKASLLRKQIRDMSATIRTASAAGSRRVRGHMTHSVTFDGISDVPSIDGKRAQTADAHIVRAAIRAMQSSTPLAK